LFQIPYLEMPITHICSLHCDGCSAYANYNIKKTVSLETATSWFETWSKRFAPNRFRVLGGEPFIHPDLPALVLTIRNFWPEAHIQVCTNGLNLDRHPEMGALLAEENMSLWLSVHSREPNYVAKINKACETLESWTSQYGPRLALATMYRTGTASITAWAAIWSLSPNRIRWAVGRRAIPSIV